MWYFMLIGVVVYVCFFIWAYRKQK